MLAPLATLPSGIRTLQTIPGNLQPIPQIGKPVLPDDERLLAAVIDANAAVLAGLIVPVPATLTDLYVSPATGNDGSGDGTLAKPFATIARAQQTLGPNPVFVSSFTLHILDACSENVNLHWTIGGTTGGVPTVLEVLGSETVFATTVLTAVQNRVPSTNTRQQMSDGATNWAASVSKLVRNATAGNRFGTKASVLANNGAGVAEIGTWIQTTEATIQLTPTERLALVGDTVEVVTLTSFTGVIAVHVSGLNDVANSKFFLRGFTLGSVSPTITSDGPNAYIVDCIAATTVPVYSNVTSINVIYTGGAPKFGPVPCSLFGGAAVTTTFAIDGGSHVTAGLGFVAKAVLTTVSENGTYLATADMASYDWPAGGAWTVRRGGIVAMTGAAALWGTSAVVNSFALNVVDTGAFDLASGTTWALTVPAAGAVATPCQVRGAALNFPTGLLLPEPGTDGVYAIKVPVVANGVLTTFDSAEIIPTAATITSAWFRASIAFSGGTVVTMGRAGATTEFVAVADAYAVDNAGLPLYTKNQITTPAAAGALRISLSGAAAAGTGIAILFLSTPKT